jgi:predicted PolB exonuclease-like 3'-5' exonuclease
MIKSVFDTVWAFDVEWIPDPVAGKLLYGAADITPNQDVMELMWEQAGATAEMPRPYLKTVLCRIVSIAAVERRVRKPGNVTLSLVSLPKEPDSAEQTNERQILETFLEAVERRKPQLVGYNSSSADLVILAQRAVVHGLNAPGFASRPDKPWEGVDYFHRSSDWHIDLSDGLSPWGRGMPSLNEITVLSGIPGKIDVAGEMVADLWLDGQVGRIVAYNECDAVSTYLLWLRVAHLAGLFTTSQYKEEQERVYRLLEELGEDPAKSHLVRYKEAWDEQVNRLARLRG